MIRVTVHNYRQLLEQMEMGDHPYGQEQCLLDFLYQNPGLIPPSDDEIRLTPMGCELPPPIKLSLKKPPFLRNGIEDELDYLCIAELEGDIGDGERMHLNLMAAGNSYLSQLRATFASTILTPNTSIVFQPKAMLKRRFANPPTPKGFKWLYGVAASAALLAGILIAHYIFTTGLNDGYAPSADLSEHGVVQIPPAASKPVVQSVTAQAYSTYQSDPSKTLGDSNETADGAPKDVPTNHNPSETIPRYVKPKAIDRIYPVKVPNQHDISPLLALQTAGAHGAVALQQGEMHPPPTATTRTVGLIELVQMGITKISSVTGAELALTAHKHPDGTIRRITFESNLFALSTPVGKRD